MKAEKKERKGGRVSVAFIIEIEEGNYVILVSLQICHK